MTITVTATDLGAHIEGSQRPDLLLQTRVDDHELPDYIEISFYDPDADYQQGTEYASRLVTYSDGKVNLSIPVSLSHTEGAQVADVLLSRAWTERTGYKIFLPFSYVRIEPTDELEFTLNSVTYTMLATRIKYVPPALLEIEAVSYDSDIYTSNATGGVGPTIAQTVIATTSTNYELLDIPILRDVDNNGGFYISAGGYASGWTGATVYRSADSGATYASLTSIINAGSIGTTTDALATTTNPWQWDRTNTVNVFMVNATLSSDTEANVLAGANAMLLGSEIIHFTTATLEADGTYTLSNLIRARRGTEWATHTAGERAVLLTTAKLVRISDDNSNINSAFDYKGVSFGKAIQNVSSESFTNTGIGLKPYAPVNIKGSRSGGDLTITWDRRSRLSAQSLWDPPLGEDSESYEIDIMSGGSPEVIRTLTSTSETVTYTAAQQATDWGSPQPTSVIVKIYQLSATLGRGYAGTATI